MQKLSDFLGRFVQLAQSSDDAKTAVVEALKTCAIKFEGIQAVSIRGSVVTLKMTPVQKSEVFLKQKKLLVELARNPLTKNITIVR
jgi:hypothetical protein